MGKTLNTKRLILRPLLQKDFGLWKKTLSSLNTPSDRFDAASWIEKEDLSKEVFLRKVKKEKEEIRNDQSYSFHSFLKSSSEYIGYASLSCVVRGPFQEAQILYEIFNQFVRKGYATEAIKALMD